VYPGVIVFALAMALVGWTLAVNRHAETTVRIQTDRGHAVVTWGPYRFVRHPMYVGAIFMYAGTPLVWGSVAALGISSAIILLFVWRTVLEDRMLQRELPGYVEYAARTRFRLIPGLW
jgi:protein-S-isoprenylcysteine O-methyltransferase Ste14